MEFREISDEEWGFIRPLLPPGAETGRPRADDRATVNGILFVLITGCRWMDMPSRYGSYKTAWRRLRRWGAEGVWVRIFRALASLKGYDRVVVDSSTVEAKKGGS